MRMATFEHCMNDYLDFDSMVHDWKCGFGKEKSYMSIQACPGGRGIARGSAKYDFRSKTTAAKRMKYTFVDPTKYGWTANLANAGNSRASAPKGRQSGRISKNTKRKASQSKDSKPRPRRLTARPDMWHYDYEEKDERWATGVRNTFTRLNHSLFWSYKDGQIFPLCTTEGKILGDSPARDIEF